MPAGATYEAISTYTHTGGSTTQIDMTSIPQTYTDLVVVGNVIYSANAGDYLSYRLNGNSTNGNYAIQRMAFNSSSVSPDRGTDNKFVGYSASASQYVPFIMNLFNYTNTSYQKSAILRIHNAGTTSMYYGGTFTPTSAITQVSLFFAASSIAAGTTITIYGIKAA